METSENEGASLIEDVAQTGADLVIERLRQVQPGNDRTKGVDQVADFKLSHVLPSVGPPRAQCGLVQFT
jgi:hypothetical protein